MYNKETDFKPGDKVTYVGTYKGREWGIVKSTVEWNSDVYLVVFNCKGDWDNYMNYEAALTLGKNIRMGWQEQENEEYLFPAIP